MEIYFVFIRIIYFIIEKCPPIGKGRWRTCEETFAATAGSKRPKPMPLEARHKIPTKKVLQHFIELKISVKIKKGLTDKYSPFLCYSCELDSIDFHFGGGRFPRAIREPPRANALWGLAWLAVPAGVAATFISIKRSPIHVLSPRAFLRIYRATSINLFFYHR